MTSADRWTRIEVLYHEAAARSGVERAAFLAAECGDDHALRSDVESLLAQDVSAAPFLEEPASVLAARLLIDQIPVRTGQMIGPYRIEELLGAGGMGDVYRAHDTVLGRDVAIKILPDAFNRDPERLARFEYEARILASVNHPHIGAIYGVQEADGVRALVLELVDGETLAERLRRGPLPLGEAKRVARQVAEALDAAHQRGIIHRDLKPANIKITADGITKVLDFGLATTAPDPDGSRASESATDEARGKVIVGTVAYMSPEQARGSAVDKRTDIWAFGCLLYEMLTGCVAFAGETAAERLAGVLEGEPDWTRLPSTLPTDLRLLIQRCLEKDPKRRRRDIGDILIDLDAAQQTPATSAARPFSAAKLGLWAAVMLLGVTGLVMSLAPSTEEDSPSPLANLSLLLPAGMDFSRTNDQIAVSPDGTMIAYAAEFPGEAPRLVLKRLDGAADQILSDTIDARDPFFSPDGRWLGFFVGDTVKKLSIATLRSQVICQATAGQTGWWGNGFVLFGERTDLPQNGIRRVAENGGPVEVLTRPDRGVGETNHGFPQVLPDGRTLLYTARSSSPDGVGHRVMLQQPGGHGRVLLNDAGFAQYVGVGALIYQRGRSLLIGDFDVRALTMKGEGIPVFSDLSPSDRPAWAAGGDLLVYRPRDENRRFVWVHRDGTELSVPAPPKQYSAPSLSPNGDRIAVEVADGLKYDVWTFDIGRQALTKFTSNGSSRYPMWTPDGRRVGMVRRSAPELYWQPADGGESSRLLRGDYHVWIGSWTRDARTLIYMQENPRTHSDLWAVDLGGAQRPRPLLQTPAREYGGRVSPDGRWLSYFSDVTGRFELYVTRFDRGSHRWPISTGGAREAVWSKDGRELFYRDATGTRMLAVRMTTAGPVLPGNVLFEGGYFSTGGPGIVNYDVTPDGQRFLMLKRVENRTPHLTVVHGLSRLVGQHLHPGQ